MTNGIAPALLLEQVKNTASWAVSARNDEVGSQTSPTWTWRSHLTSALALSDGWGLPEGRVRYLSLLLAAHFVTVGTFVPTDVDNRIRYHVWQEMKDRESIEACLRAVDETDWWDASVASARVVRVAGCGQVSGHDGEWLSVRAGALGRALALKLDDVAESIAARIASELEREAVALQTASRTQGAEIDALRLSTVVSHNLGDLSRVVEDWPVRSPAAKHWTAQFARLGHEHADRYDGVFVRAGQINKAIMAMENHRFLPLRKPKVLRRSRDYLLPIGPFFDAWGERISSHPDMDTEGLADVLTALLEGHCDEPSQLGYLRAMAGIQRGHSGGLESLAQDVPARLRKLVNTGAVRDALRVDVERFEARLLNRYRAARSATV